MNLCIMPKPCGIVYNYNNFNTSPHFFISKSVFVSLSEMKLKIDAMMPNSELSEICKICNPHEYVFSNTEPATPSIGKMNPPSNLYYELYEIFNTFGLFKQSIKTVLYIDNEMDNTADLLFNSLFNSSVDIIPILINDTINHEMLYKCVDVIICNIGVQLSNALHIILMSLNKDGNIIIKLSNIYHKTNIAILYLLSIMFEKTILIKPSVINVMSCDIFILGISYLNNHPEYAGIDISFISVPTLFLCKIEEFNTVNGHKQLDAFEQVINLFYNKNKIVKLDLIKKTNIIKSITWCDKQKVPYNKIGYTKTNIFLNPQHVE